MNNSINIVAITSHSLQINDKEVSKKARKREYNKKRYQLNKTKIQEYSQRPEVKARKQKYNQRYNKRASKIINQIHDGQIISDLKLEQVSSERLQFNSIDFNDIYDQQTITRALNALEPEQIIWLNQSLDELLVNNDISERNYRKYHL